MTLAIDFTAQRAESVVDSEMHNGRKCPRRRGQDSPARICLNNLDSHTILVITTNL